MAVHVGSEAKLVFPEMTWLLLLLPMVAEFEQVRVDVLKAPVTDSVPIVSLPEIVSL